jgi:hypothetical protein
MAYRLHAQTIDNLIDPVQKNNFKKLNIRPHFEEFVARKSNMQSKSYLPLLCVSYTYFRISSVFVEVNLLQ